MIYNKKDLKEYIKADFEAQNMSHPFLARLTYGENYAMYKYMKVLRKLEYYTNVSSNLFTKIARAYYLLLYRRNCIKYQIHISPNVVDKGFCMIHPGFRRVGSVIKHMGQNCTVLPMVLFGKKTPEIGLRCIEVGDNCYFGTGCTILGPVKIGNNVTIGAGAVVTQDIPDGCTAVGVPAKIVRTKVKG